MGDAQNLEFFKEQFPLLVDFAFGGDYVTSSNPDGNGFYQLYTFRKGGITGKIVGTIELTYNVTGEVLTAWKRPA